MVEKNVIIVSGGRTGVERAALNFAIERGIDYDRCCDVDRTAADFTPVDTVDMRVAGSDLTIAFNPGVISPVTGKAVEACVKYEKPLYVINSEDDFPMVNYWLDSLMKDGLRINIEGPTEAECPGVYRRMIRIMCSLFLR